METVSLEQLRQQLKTFKDKCQLQNKKIKLYRKENQEYRLELTRQTQVDSSLLLHSKELSEANSKLQNAITDISLKLDLELDNVTPLDITQPKHRPVSLLSIRNITVTEQTQEVDLANESVTDEDISQLAPFKNIKSLLLGQNQVGNAGLVSIIGNLTKVTKLQLNSNAFQAVSLSKLSNLTQLKVLDVRNNKLGDECMPFIGKLTHIVQLSVSKNSITNSGLKEIIKLTQLLYLDLTTNLITDQGVPHLLGFKRLTNLYLMSNKLTQQSVPAIFHQLTGLEVLDIRFNINQPTAKQNLKNIKPQKIQLFC